MRKFEEEEAVSRVEKVVENRIGEVVENKTEEALGNRIEEAVIRAEEAFGIEAAASCCKPKSLQAGPAYL